MSGLFRTMKKVVLRILGYLLVVGRARGGMVGVVWGAWYGGRGM